MGDVPTLRASPCGQCLTSNRIARFVVVACPLPLFADACRGASAELQPSRRSPRTTAHRAKQEVKEHRAAARDAMRAEAKSRCSCERFGEGTDGRRREKDDFFDDFLDGGESPKEGTCTKPEIPIADLGR